VQFLHLDPDPDPDPETQINAGPFGSGSETLGTTSEWNKGTYRRSVWLFRFFAAAREEIPKLHQVHRLELWGQTNNSYSSSTPTTRTKTKQKYRLSSKKSHLLSFWVKYFPWPPQHQKHRCNKISYVKVT
jgi:hypothetical protein